MVTGNNSDDDTTYEHVSYADSFDSDADSDYYQVDEVRIYAFKYEKIKFLKEKKIV